MKNYYPMHAMESEFLAEDEEREENPTESPRDETFAYLQKIAKTPLLEPEQETALFEKYQEGLRTFTNLLNQFPDWMLVSLEIPEEQDFKQQREIRTGTIRTRVNYKPGPFRSPSTWRFIREIRGKGKFVGADTVANF